MYVTLAGWETRGLRCPDTKVNFVRDNDYKRINLVQMPNGTGKSTIIELIGAALTGDSRFWSSDKIIQFASNEIPSDVGQFVLKLLLKDEGQDIERTIIFQMDFDFSAGTIAHSTLGDPTVGLEVGWKAPRDLITFLNDRCVEVFVFKGDKVRHLIEKGRNDAEASVKAFFGLSHIEDLVEKIDKEFSGKQAKITTSQGFNKRKNVLDEWVAWLEKLENKEKELEAELKPIRARYDEIKTRVEEIFSGQTKNEQERADLTRARDEANQELAVDVTNAFEALRNPLFVAEKIAVRMNDLRENLDSMKLPGTSGEFFKELASQDYCVCGRAIDEQSKEAILKNAKTFLSDNHIEIINGIKRDTQTYSMQAKQKKENNPFEKLTSSSENVYSAETRLQRHLSKMKEEATASEQNLIEEFEKVNKEKDTKELQLNHLRDDTGNMKQASSGSPEQCKKIPLVKKVIELRQKELAEISDTVQDYNAKEKLKRILSMAAEKALRNIKAELKEKSNAKLKRILPEGTPLEILDIDKNIQLGFKGRQQASASGGQNVSVAYSFATSILERSGAQFPLIVDHPVTALQESARRGLGKNLAEICHQFIGFIIDTEKVGFVQSLQSTSDDANYITLFKKIPGNQPYIEQLPSDTRFIYESDNGIVCTDKEFFNNFRDLTPNLSE